MSYKGITRHNHTNTIIVKSVIMVLFCLSVIHFLWAFWIVGATAFSYPSRVMPDFAWYEFAFRNVWFHGGHGLYNTTSQHAWLIKHHFTAIGKNIYAYPPLFAVLFSPLGLLSTAQAFWIWNILSAVSYFILLAVLGMWSTGNWTHRLLIASLGLAVYPVFENFFMGQADVILACLIGLGMYAIYRRNNEWVGGALIGVAACLKVTPAVFLLFWLLQGRWRIVRSGIVVAFLSVVFTAFVVPGDSYLFYVFHTLGQVNAVDFQYGGAPWNESFKGILMATRLRTLAPISAWVAGLGSLAGYLWYFKAKLVGHPHDSRLVAAVLTLLVLLASPVIEIHTWVIAAIPLSLSTGYWIDRVVIENSKREAITALILLLVSWTLFIIPDAPFVLPAVNGPYLVKQLVPVGFSHSLKVWSGYVSLPAGLGAILIAIQHMTATLLGLMTIILGLRPNRRAAARHRAETMANSQ